MTALKADIETKSKKEIESLGEEGCREMLREKWIVPLLSGLKALAELLGGEE